MKAVFTFLTSLFLIQQTVGQDSAINVPAVSIYAGAFVSDQRGFASTYGSTLCFSSGGTVRFPLPERFFAVGKASYVFKSNHGYELRQWIMDIGPGHIFTLSDDFYLTASAGLAFSIFLDTFPQATVIGRTSGDMNYGVFSAIAVERNVPSMSCSFYVEAYYSWLPRKYVTYTHDYGGAEVLAGIRYQFHQ